MMQLIDRALALLMAISALSCHAEERCPLPKKPVASIDEAISFSQRVTSAYHLSSVSIACLDFKPSKQYVGAGYEIVIREIHSSECGGDESTSPRVANINITLSGYVTTDVYSPETGEYKPLVCQKRKAVQAKH